MKITKKILTSLTLSVLALGLAGCTYTNNTTSINKKPESATSSKIVKAPSHKNSQKIASSESQSSQVTQPTNNLSENSTANTATTYASSASTNNVQQSVSQPQSQQKVASQVPVNGQISDAQNQEILNTFFNANNLTPQSGNNYIVSQLGSGEYQIEVRTNNDDNSVSHLNDLYKYNTSTNQTQHLNSVNGQWQ